MSYFGYPLYPVTPTTQLTESNISGTTTLGVGAATYTKAFLITGAGGYTITLPALDATNYTAATFSISNTASATCTINVNGTSADTMEFLGSTYTSISILPGERMIFQNMQTIWMVGLESASRTTTASQFDSTIRTASTAFVQRALGSQSGVLASSSASGLALAAANFGAIIDLAAGFAGTVTLPLASAGVPGAGFYIFNGSGTAITVQRSGSDLLFPSAASVTSIPMAAGDTLLITIAGASSWIAYGGSAQLQYSGTMSGANWTTPAQFDNSTKFATTAFVQRALGNTQGVVSVGTNTTLTTAQIGSYVQITSGAPLTITLPVTSASIYGGCFYFYNNTSGNVTIAGNGAQTINNGLINSNTYVLAPGASVILCTDGVSWSLIAGTGFFQRATNGYQRLPSGLILQWGTSTFSTGGSAVTFPITFPTALFGVYLGNPNSSAAVPATSSNTTSGFTGAISSGASASIYWSALGY